MSFQAVEPYAGTYSVPQPYVLAGKRPRVLNTPGVRRWSGVVFAIAVIAWVVWAVSVVAERGLGSIITEHYPVLLLVLGFWCFGHLLDRVPYTEVSSDTLTARTGMVTKRSVLWTDVQPSSPPPVSTRTPSPSWLMARSWRCRDCRLRWR